MNSYQKILNKKISWHTVVVFTILCIFAGLIWLFWRGSPDEILSVANRFKPDSSWNLKDESVRPPAHDCIDIRCPKVVRTWQVNSTLTPELIMQISTILSNTGWDFNYNRNCRERRPYNPLSCVIYNAEGKYDVRVLVHDSISNKFIASGSALITLVVVKP